MAKNFDEIRAKGVKVGDTVSFIQKHRTARGDWNGDTKAYDREPLPDKVVIGAVTSVSIGEGSVEITVRGGRGRSTTAHLQGVRMKKPTREKAS